MTLLLTLPFIILILGVALGPILAPAFWHKHDWKVAFSCAGLTYVLYSSLYNAHEANDEIIYVMLKEYIPFMIAAFGLFTVTGGIKVHLKANPSPALNTLILAIGALGSNLFGTSGISMLLIRPFLKLNYHRTNRMHQVMFFIFIVANVGGSLTPLGDPPLFLGFLNGISFFWTTKYLFLPFAVTTGLLLLIFYLVDKKKCLPEFQSFYGQPIHFSIEGKRHFILLFGIIFFILLSGFWHNDTVIMVKNFPLKLTNLVRDIGILSMAIISLMITPMKKRHAHEFNWNPIIEVAQVFFGLFITLFPIINFLAAASPSLEPYMTSTKYFWITGLFSAFLDNAPTYLVFFHLSGGDPTWLMTTGYKTLMAISLGSVYLGALTYIGNAPNFMVRSIAKNYQMEMPSFFGYMAWSITILIPIYIFVKYLFVH